MGRAGGDSQGLLAPVPVVKALKAELVAINNNVMNVMSPVSELIEQTPRVTPSGAREYGPENLPRAMPAATFRLTTKKLQDHKYGWQLDAKPLGTDDSQYRAVLVGSLENAVRAHHGAGQATFYLDALQGVNPAAFPGTGQIISTTAAGPQKQSSLVVRLVNFSADGKVAAVSKVYAVDRTADGVHHFRRLNSAPGAS
jgi:hypothetical protein